MEKVLSDKEYQHMMDEYDKVKYRCKCGYRVIIPHNVDKQICRKCRRYVFKTNQEEFKYRLKEKIKWASEKQYTNI